MTEVGHWVCVQVKSSSDDQSVLEYVHGLYEDLGIHDLTIQTKKS